jgi:hypothetical protein
MKAISKETKEKVEKCLKEKECAINIVWGEDSCTTFDAEGNAIEDFMIDVEDNGDIYYTPISDTSVTIQVA